MKNVNATENLATLDFYEETSGCCFFPTLITIVQDFLSRSEGLDVD